MKTMIKVIIGLMSLMLATSVAFAADINGAQEEVTGTFKELKVTGLNAKTGTSSAIEGVRLMANGNVIVSFTVLTKEGKEILDGDKTIYPEAWVTAIFSNPYDGDIRVDKTTLDIVKGIKIGDVKQGTQLAAPSSLEASNAGINGQQISISGFTVPSESQVIIVAQVTAGDMQEMKDAKSKFFTPSRSESGSKAASSSAKASTTKQL
jgi:hypothetical protein